MIRKSKLEEIELTGNYLIVKTDPNYDFVPMQTPDGEIKIHLNYLPQDESKHVSITGKVLSAPNELKYFGEELLRSAFISNEEKASLMRNSLPYKTTSKVDKGDVIYFDYHNQFNADNEGRLIEIEGYGICMLIKYDTIYGKEQEGKFVPLNGWVVFKREQKPDRFETQSGLIVIQKVNIYESNIATVICADENVDEYLDGSYEGKLDLKEGMKIMFDARFGYRIAYSIHAGEMKDYEMIRRKNILATFD